MSSQTFVDIIAWTLSFFWCQILQVYPLKRWITNWGCHWFCNLFVGEHYSLMINWLNTFRFAVLLQSCTSHTCTWNGYEWLHIAPYFYSDSRLQLTDLPSQIYCDYFDVSVCKPNQIPYLGSVRNSHINTVFCSALRQLFFVIIHNPGIRNEILFILNL